MATIGFEEELWASADKLRNNMDAAEYKHVVLGLIFLKYVSDTFMEKYKELLEEDEDFGRRYGCILSRRSILGTRNSSLGLHSKTFKNKQK